MTANAASVPAEAETTFQRAQAAVAAQRMDEALALHLQAAQAGHVGAQLEAGRMLLYGIAGTADPRAAVEWFARAEEAGHPAASDFLALIALGGIAQPRDARINQRLMHAAQSGHPGAQLTLALHFGRKPHAEDQTLCLQLLERAAGRGHALAAMLLAERLAHGEGCEAQPETAEDLRAQLVANGFERLPAFTLPVPTWQPPSASRQVGIEEVLQPPTPRQMHDHPRIGVIDQLFSSDECRLLIASAAPHLHASQTADPVTGIPYTLPVRTSSETSFDTILETSAVRLTLLRMAAAARIDLPHGEQLTVLRYAPGQQYRPHRDYLPAGTLQLDRPHAGNRSRTIIVYLNPVQAGGATDFPAVGVRVDPQPGRAVVFDNMDEQGRMLADSLHAGMPVEAGEKWLATLWIRQGRYRDF